MDPPPPLPTTTTCCTSTVTTTAAPITATSIHINYPDSVDSSPRSHTADGYENEPLPPVPGAKLRLMCSYGGHIIPRPHDKSLCYVGGETRLVVVDRHSTLSSLSSRLSRSLLNGRPFTLKYQLPNEELDSLVSVTTEEDLENMIEEYDRLMSSSTPPSLTTSTRIRLFIFFSKPETSASMGSLLDDAKSETWFVDALNGSGMLPRGLSDTTMDCLLNLDNDNDLEARLNHDGNLNNKQHVIKNVVAHHDVQYSTPDSPVVETTSSFGSSSSSPSMSNLPPIRVRVDEHSRHMEEQFAQMSFGSAVKPDDHGGVADLPPPVPVGLTGGVSHGGDNCRILSDDERSDHGGGSSVAVNRLRKPPLPLQPVQHKVSTPNNLPSPDSVKSDSSIASGSSLSKPMYCQDQVAAPPRENRAPSPSSPNTKPDNLPPIPSPQIQDPAYNMLPQVDHQQQQQPQQRQQQYVHASMHYISHPATTPVPISSFYHPIYAPPQHHPIDQQYPVYVMPVPQTQPYMSMQSNITDAHVMPSSRPPTPAVISASAAAYKDTTPPVYPTKVATTTTQAKVVSEIPAGVNRTATATTVNATPPQLVQIPGTQYQQQYVAAGYSQMQHPSQAIAVAVPNASANYGYNEYANNIPVHDQVYYTATQHQAAVPLPPQYHTMTPAAAVAALVDASKQLPVDSTTQQIRTSQPM